MRAVKRLSVTSISIISFLLLLAVWSSGLVMAAQDALICPADRINSNGNICTAADVSLAAAAVSVSQTGLTCSPGEPIQVALVGNVNLRKGDRFDIGVWVSTDGKPMDLRGGSNGTPDEGGAQSCEVVPLPYQPVAKDTPPFDIIIDSYDSTATPRDCYDTKAANNGDESSNFVLTSERDSIINGLVDSNNDGTIDASDDTTGATFPQVFGAQIVAGAVDISNNGSIENDGSDDGVWNGYAVVNGVIDVDGDGSHGELDGSDDSEQAYNDLIEMSCVADPVTGQLALETLVTWHVPSDAANVCAPTDPDTFGDFDNQGNPIMSSSKCSVNSSSIAVDVVGKLTIGKVALLPDGTASSEDFTFTYTNDSPPLADEDPNIPDISPPGTGFPLKHLEFDSIYAEIGTGPATVVITESDIPSGWDLADLTCSGDDTVPTVIDLANKKATVTLQYNDANPLASQANVICSFVNKTLPSITVVKNTAGGNGVFPFTGSFNAFSLDTGTTGTARRIFPNLDPNLAYNIEEVIPDTWVLASASCGTANEQVTIDTDIGAISNIELELGQDITCTFNNSKAGTVTFTKIAVGDNGTFDYTTGGNPLFSLTTSGTPSGGSSPPTAFNFSAGTYTIVESEQAGWTLTDISCTESATQDTTWDVPSRTLTLRVQTGETITCEFTNAADATLNVIKQTLPDGDPASFTFTGTVAGTISDGGNLSVSGPTGVFTTNESALAGWDVSDIACSGDTLSTVLIGGTSEFVDGDTDVSANIAPGETITCFYINTKRGSVTIVKHLSAESSADKDFDFTSDLPGYANFTLSPTDPASDDQLQVLDLKPGLYEVSETDPASIGWALTNTFCEDSSPVSGILLDPGEDLTCTFTNSPIGSATIIKNSVGGDGQFDFLWGTATNGNVPVGEAAAFPLITPGPTGTKDFSNKLLIGEAYDLSETDTPGTVGSYLKTWNLTETNCLDATGDSTFNPGLNGADATIVADTGETVACTFTNTLDGTLVIRKQTISDQFVQDFTFTGTTPALTGPLQDYDIASAELSQTGVPGTYGSTETVPAGWTLTDISCSGAINSTISVGGTPTFVAGDTGVSVDVASGETVICTFTNTKQGSLTIVKDSIGATGSFSFNHNVPNVASPFVIDTAVDDANLVSTTLLPGSYRVSEVIPTGWDLNLIACTGQSDSTITIGGSGGFDPGDDAVTVDMLNGEDIICTFTNTQQGRILVDKVTDPVGSVQSFSFTPSWGADFSLTDAAPVNDSGFLSASSVSGSYSVSETAVAGWDQTSATCSGDGNTPAAINLLPGETVTCTFTNTQQSRILVDKVTDPFGSTESFDFTSSYGSPFSLTDADVPNDSGPLVPGQYSVAEAAKTGWDLTSATCSDGSAPGAIDLAAGETVTCTFTNTIQRGKIVVDKVTNPTGSLQSFAFVTNYGAGGFSLTDAAVPNDSGELLPTSEFGQSYSVVESLPAGWTLTSAVCDDGSDPSAIDLAPGETVTCTFTNTVQPGQIVVNKQTAPTGSPQLFDFTLTGTGVNQGFQLADATTPFNSGNLLPTSENGTYNIAETLPADWSLISATCSDGSTPSAVDLSPGETVTCTFLNAQGGTSTFTKVSIGGDDTFNFTASTESGNFSLTTTNGISPPSSITELAAGSYTIVEDVLSGWDLTDLVCTESDIQDSTTDVATRTITLNVQEGETINCIVTNTKRGSISVSKVTVPTGNPASFTFTGDVAGGIADGGTILVSDLPPGVYTSVESALAGWDLTGIECDDGASTTPSSGDVQTMTATFNLDAGEDVICTFTNTLRPLINLAKTVNGAATLEANGTYTVGYTILATNTGGPGAYDLVDAFSPGAGITLNSATAVYVAGTENAQTGALGAYPNFVTGEGLEAGLNESWTVTANFTVDPATLDPASNKCDPATPAINTGFYNAVSGSSTDTDLTDNETCTGLMDPIINLAKTVNGPAALQGDGSYNVLYTITATNTGGPGVYDLVDTLSPGDGIALNTATAAYLAGTESTQTGTLGAYPNFVSGEGLAEGLNESWTVTANFAVDPALVDPLSSQCNSAAPIIDTGFYNAVTGSDSDTDLTDNNACTGLPEPGINLAKTVNGPAAIESDGSYTVIYTITATNTGGPGVYDLVDTFSPGSGITLNTATAVYVAGSEDSQSGTLAAYPNFVTGEGLAERKTESWTVTANFTVDPALVDPVDSQCDPAAPVINTGFYNAVTGSDSDTDLTDNDACTGLPEPGINLAKTVVGSALLEADGTFTVVYTITATNTGGPGVYDLVDTFSPGSGITLNTATAVYVAGSEDSQSGTLAAYPNFVAGEALADGLNESWTVTANFTIDPAMVDPVDSQCDPSAPAINTGFYNAVTGSDTDMDLTDNETCTGLPFAILTVMKQVNGGSALPSDFLLTLTGADGTHDSGVDYVSGDQPAIQIGVEYTLSEMADQVLDYMDDGVRCVDNAGNTPVPHPVTLSAGQSVTCIQVNMFMAPPAEVLDVPVNDKLALLLLTLMLLASGWYFRPATMRRF